MQCISVLEVGELRDNLRDQGFCFINGRDFHLSRDFERDKIALKAVFGGGRSDGPTRRRYYSRYLLGPHSTIDTLALGICSSSYLSSDYRQGVDLNPEQRGALRTYAPLPEEIWNNRLLKALIFFDLNFVLLDAFWSNARRNPIAVGIHFIRMVAEPGQPSVPSPSVPHQDGEPFTCIHLIGRDGVQGGFSQVFRNSRNEVVSSPGELLFESILTDILDTLIVWDRDVFHHVTPVEVADGYQYGTRDVLIIDFTPFEECKFNSRGEIGIDSANFCSSLSLVELR